MMLLAIFSISVLASCGLNKNRSNTEPSSALSSVSKDDKSSTSTEAKTENTSDSSTKVSQSTAENKKETGPDLYKEVIERYNHYTDLLHQGNRENLEEEIKQNDIASEEYGLIFSRMDYQNAPDFKYALVDLNKDGQDELLIGYENFVSAIYYLDNQKPSLLHTAYVASAGGFRSGFVIYENGLVSYADWQSTRPEMNLALYSFDKNGVQKIKEATIQIGGNEKAEQVLDISSEKLDLSNIDWKELNPAN
ncbi:hypothetical protein SIN_0151 [Streptococcus infantis SK1302]|uniref:Lipoprotein n=1 Tax=Streptococcus infantis SK1302 TaxID=871237 RepID=A0ABP2JD13_9STRE|nr:hypothetical protein SIN_0151 [Streptococcus infantis SK1302]